MVQEDLSTRALNLGHNTVGSRYICRHIYRVMYDWPRIITYISITILHIYRESTCKLLSKVHQHNKAIGVCLKCPHMSQVFQVLAEALYIITDYVWSMFQAFEVVKTSILYNILYFFARPSAAIWSNSLHFPYRICLVTYISRMC